MCGYDLEKVQGMASNVLGVCEGAYAFSMYGFHLYLSKRYWSGRGGADLTMRRRRSYTHMVSLTWYAKREGWNLE